MLAQKLDGSSNVLMEHCSDNGNVPRSKCVTNTSRSYAQIDDLTFVMSQEEIDQVGLR